MLKYSERLSLALQQIRNVEKLAEDLDYSKHILQHTSVVKYELQRQLALNNAHPTDLMSDTWQGGTRSIAICPYPWL